MSVARQTFLERMSGAYKASQDRLLLDPVGAPKDEVQAARLLRNGLAVTCFAAFEGFFFDRTQEIAAWLTSQSLPFSGYPIALGNAASHRGVSYLSTLMKRDADPVAVKSTIVELGESWTRMGGGGWRLPHAALMWSGSNLNAGEALSILGAFGVAHEWGDISGVAQAAGFTNLPTKNLFNEIAQRRHDSAHQASYDADILLLRATPGNLTAFAFSVDVLLSHAARAIARGMSVLKGRQCISLTRLDRSQTDASWEEYAGPVPASKAATPAVIHANLEAGVSSCKAKLNSPTDVLLIRDWNGAQHTVMDWHTMGV